MSNKYKILREEHLKYIQSKSVLPVSECHNDIHIDNGDLVVYLSFGDWKWIEYNTYFQFILITNEESVVDLVKRSEF